MASWQNNITWQYWSNISRHQPWIFQMDNHLKQWCKTCVHIHLRKYIAAPLIRSTLQSGLKITKPMFWRGHRKTLISILLNIFRQSWKSRCHFSHNSLCFRATHQQLQVFPATHLHYPGYNRLETPLKPRGSTRESHTSKALLCVHSWSGSKGKRAGLSTVDQYCSKDPFLCNKVLFGT